MIKLFNFIQMKRGFILEKVYLFVFIKLLHLKEWKNMNKLY